MKNEFLALPVETLQAREENCRTEGNQGGNYSGALFPVQWGATLTLLSWSLPSGGADRQEVSRAVINPDVGSAAGKIQGGAGRLHKSLELQGIIPEAI